MKKLFVIIMSLLFTANIFCLDISYSGSDETVYHDHDIYQLLWSKNTKNAIYCVYTLKSDIVIESEAVNNRTNDFRQCLLGSSKPKDYSKTGYDKGHLCENASWDYDKATASLTFLMCNMTPQTPALNRGIWKKYEDIGRNLAKARGKCTVICGPIYDESLPIVYIGDKVRVPDGFFKVFITDDAVRCFVFTQTNDKPEIASLKDIEIISGVVIKND